MGKIPSEREHRNMHEYDGKPRKLVMSNCCSSRRIPRRVPRGA